MIYEEMLEKIKNAYSPYYKFTTCSCVVTKKGKYFGVNVENANGTSICAERNAIAAAVCDGNKRGDFEKIYIMFENGEFGVPCFACRQVILEFFEKDKKVISITTEGEEKEYTVDELCPHAFSMDDLK